MKIQHMKNPNLCQHNMDAPTFEVPKNLDIPLISTCKKYGVDGKPNKQCRRNSDSSSKLAFTFFQFVIFQQN